MEVYLDNSSTTKPISEVVDIMNKSFTEYFGNPSSLHRKGVEIEKEIKKARRKVARALGAKEKETFFTSGGTESNNLAIMGSLKANKRKGKHIITTKIEHPSVLEVFNYLEQNGYEVTYLNVNNEGIIDLDSFKNSLRDDTTLISIMFVNNEVGSIQPIEEISNITRNHKNSPILHVDAIQAFGKINYSLKSLDVDLMSISAHKFHGPKGIGALYIKEKTKLNPIVLGGKQEFGIRSGTENVPGILGMGEAAEKTITNINHNIEKLNKLRNRLLEGIKDRVDDIKINSSENINFAPHILNISFLGIKGEILLHTLEQQGIYVSTGSACSSRKKTFSHVLKEMGLRDNEMDGAIRFSFSPYNTEKEIKYTLDKLELTISDLRKVMSRR